MKRTFPSLRTRGVALALCLAIVSASLLADAVVEPSVARARSYIVDISLGNNPVPSGTGSSVTVRITDDWIYDTYSSTSSAFFLRAWVFRNDSTLSDAPSCHGSGWPSSRSITPNSDGNRIVVTFRISGSCPLREGSGYSIRADVVARMKGTDTVVANRAITFTVEGTPPTVTHTPSPTATATATPGNLVENLPEQPTKRPISRPADRPTSTPTLTPTPTQAQSPIKPDTELPPTVLPSQPIGDPELPITPTLVFTSIVVTSGPPVSTPTPETGKPEPPPPTLCIVAHTATPVQVCRDNKSGALHFFFVGHEDVFSGPMFPSITEMMSAYPPGYEPSEVELFRGISTGTDKEVLVHYLTYSGQLRVSTYYADSEYDVNKPYAFTIKPDGSVVHLVW